MSYNPISMTAYTEMIASTIALFLTMLLLETALSLDNLLVIATTISHLSPDQQTTVRRLALLLAFFLRLLLAVVMIYFLSIELLISPYLPSFIAKTSAQLNLKLILLVFSGLFLIAKSVSDIYSFVERIDHHPPPKHSSIGKSLFHILMMDIVFSLDSVFTAVGLTDSLVLIMIVMLTATIIIFYFSEVLVNIISQHPSIKILALAFLVSIGTALVVDGLGYTFPREILYVPLCFASIVEVLQIRYRRNK